MENTPQEQIRRIHQEYISELNALDHEYQKEIHDFLESVKEKKIAVLMASLSDQKK